MSARRSRDNGGRAQAASRSGSSSVLAAPASVALARREERTKRLAISSRRAFTVSAGDIDNCHKSGRARVRQHRTSSELLPRNSFLRAPNPAPCLCIHKSSFRVSRVHPARLDGPSFALAAEAARAAHRRIERSAYVFGSSNKPICLYSVYYNT
jgi:hypothetical protein